MAINSSLASVPITDIKISTLTLTLANTEYSLALSQSCKGLEITARGNSKLKVSFVMGDTSLLYKTIPKHTSWEINSFNFIGKTLYIQGDLAGEIVEIVELI